MGPGKEAFTYHFDSIITRTFTCSHIFAPSSTSVSSAILLFLAGAEVTPTSLLHHNPRSFPCGSSSPMTTLCHLSSRLRAFPLHVQAHLCPLPNEIQRKQAIFTGPAGCQHTLAKSLSPPAFALVHLPFKILPNSNYSCYTRSYRTAGSTTFSSTKAPDTV